jgi:DNA-binding NarL/FixJ family response regulator
LFEQLDDRRGVAIALAHLGDLASARAEFDTARTYFTRSLHLNQEIGEEAGIAFVLDRFAEAAVAQAQPRRALRLAGAAATLRARVEAELPPAAQVRLDARLEPARMLLSEDAAAAFAEGEALSLDAAVAEALTVGTPERGDSSTARADPLSAREREVAMMIARGYGNRRIAAELIIGEATVATHVQHILQKLQLATRTQVAIWAERGYSSRGNHNAAVP